MSMIQKHFNRRHSPNRRKTAVPALLELEGEALKVTIRDVSFEGMRLSVPVTVEPGSPVTIVTTGARIPAIVHWYKDHEIGVHLLDRLEGETLLKLENAADSLAAFR